MRYYQLLYDYENDKNAICCISKELNNTEQQDIEQGKLIDNWDGRITIYYNPKEGKRETDFLGNDLGWFIISEKLKAIFETEHITGIQYLSITIKNILTNENLSNYYVANICNLVDALDLEESKYDIFEIDEDEQLISVELYALKGEKLVGVDLFKLKEDTIPIFVSEKIMKCIKNNNITGCDFLEVKVI